MLSYSVVLDERRTLTGELTHFRFVGYRGDEMARMEAEIAAIDVSDEPQKVLEVRDARLTPVRSVGVNAFGGNLFQAAGEPLAQASIVREGVTVFGADRDSQASTPAGVRLDAAWYGGVLFSGYGHVLLESLARLVPEMLSSPLPILFHLNIDGLPDRAAFTAMLAYLGVETSRIRWVEGITEVGRLLVPEPGFVIGSRVHLGFARLLRDAVRARLPPPPPPRSPPVLLSRSALNSHRRRAFGEDLLEKGLSGSCRIVHPETLSFAEQVETVNGTDRLLGPVGSQMHNLLFRAREEPPEVLYLSQARPPVAYFQIDLLWGGGRTYVNAGSHGQVFPFGGASPFMLRLDRVETALKIAGFPACPDLAVDASATERVAEDFYAAWMERYIDMKLIRPSRYWAGADEALEKTEAAAALIAQRLEPALADPEIASTLRKAAEEALNGRPARKLQPELKARFVAAALGGV